MSAKSRRKKRPYDPRPWWQRGMNARYATKQSSRELAGQARSGGAYLGQDVFTGMTLLEFSELWGRAEQNSAESGCTSCSVTAIAVKMWEGRTPSHVDCVIVALEESA